MHHAILCAHPNHTCPVRGVPIQPQQVVRHRLCSVLLRLHASAVQGLYTALNCRMHGYTSAYLMIPMTRHWRMQAYRPSNLLAYWHWAVALQLLWWQFLCAVLGALYEGLGLLIRRKKRAPPARDNAVDPLQRQASFRAGQKVLDCGRTLRSSTCTPLCDKVRPVA